MDESRHLIAVGAYTAPDGAGEGMSTWWLDSDRGTLTRQSTLAMASPSFLAWHPRLPVVYAAHELAPGALSAILVEEDGSCSALGDAVPTAGEHPCHVAITPTGDFAIVTNFSSSSVAVLSLGADGSIVGRADLVQLPGSGADPVRQEQSHPHCAVLRPPGVGSATGVEAGHEWWICDLGTDKIWRFSISRDGQLTQCDPVVLPPGSGPRHLAWSQEGRWAWVSAELSAAVIPVEVVGDHATVHPEIGVGAGSGQAGDTSHPGLPSHIAVDASQRVLMAVRGQDRLITLDPDLEDEAVAAIGERPTGDWVRHFCTVGGWIVLACQNSGELQILPGAAGHSLDDAPHSSYPTGSPSCLAPRP
jgi:6-phosphogluconolactonase